MNFNIILLKYIVFETHIKLEKERDSVRDLKGYNNDKLIYISYNHKQNYPFFKNQIID